MRQKTSSSGFGLLQLMIVVAIVGIMAAVAVPSLLESYQTYQFSGATQDLAGVIMQARFQAIKLNTKVSAGFQMANGKTTGWVDLNNNGVVDGGENLLTQFVERGEVSLVTPGGSVPDSSSMGFGTTTTTPIAPSGDIAFDSRGAVNFGAGAPTIYVIYLSYQNTANAGYKAISVEPLGRVKVWSAPAYGSWHSQ